MDGGLVYKDFGKIKYDVVRDGKKIGVDSSEIVIIAGSNPYHILKEEYIDDDGNRKQLIKLEKAEPSSEGYIESGKT